LQTVFETPDLVSSLAQYSELRQENLVLLEEKKPSIHSWESHKSKHRHEEAKSTILLQVYAAADYFTTNRTLMEDVPPVFVDIILDPYIFNVFPRSLIPTTAYIVLLAIGSWYLSKYISRWVQNFTKHDLELEKKNA